MYKALWTGFLTGLWLSMSFGPVFFMLIQKSIQRGVRSALLFDLGVLLSDLFYIVVAFYGATFILNNETYREGIALGGGIILIGFGLMPFFSPSARKNVSEESPEPRVLHEIDDVLEIVQKPLGRRSESPLKSIGLVLKGFTVNFLNPSVLFIWFTAVAGAFATFEKEESLVITFFATTLITYFGIDVVKIYLALKLKRFLNPQALQLIHRLSGLVIIIFGVWLVFTTLSDRW